MIKSILIVEDDALSAEILRRYIASKEIHVDIAESGEAALSLLSKDPVDLVLTDFALPGMNGISLIHRIKGLDVSCRFIGMSSEAMSGPFRKAGADGFLQKPFGIQEVEDMMFPLL